MPFRMATSSEASGTLSEPSSWMTTGMAVGFDQDSGLPLFW